MTDSKQTASTILQQLGGNKFIDMTGSHTFVCDKNWLRMTLTKNKIGAKWLRITLNSMDTYDMEFIKEQKTLNKEYAKHGIKIYDGEAVTVKKVEGVYDDMLQQIFTDVTGLRTKLF
jgi:hypothetical protein